MHNKNNVIIMYFVLPTVEYTISVSLLITAIFGCGACCFLFAGLCKVSKNSVHGNF